MSIENGTPVLSAPARRTRFRRAASAFLVLLALGLTAVFITNDVSTTLTQEDQDYAARLLRESGHGTLVGRKVPDTFDAQVETVLAVQDAVLSTAPKNEGLPLGAPRELKDLFEAKRGLCFDRSRAIEKILTHLGFEVRHAAIYATDDTGRIRALFTPRTPSHAVTEVNTDRGWLVIDSNRRWIGLTADGDPIDLASLRKTAPDVTWDRRAKDAMSPILTGPFTYVLGLYSRHGRFYPPYSPVPDLDWSQLHYNFGG